MLTTGYERSNLGPELAKHGAHLVNDPHPKEQFFQRSDNIALARLGIIAQTVSSFGLHTDYHQVTNELKTIDFAHMTAAIASMEGPVRWLANMKWKPSWNPGGRPVAIPSVGKQRAGKTLIEDEQTRFDKLLCESLADDRSPTIFAAAALTQWFVPSA